MWTTEYMIITVGYFILNKNVLIVSVQICKSFYCLERKKGKTHGVMVNLLTCDIVMYKFKVQLHYYIHFGKGMNPLIPPARV